jgi:hypothetical protein
MNTLANWNQRYSHKKIPMPNGFDQYVRHLHEHGWTPKGGLSTYSPRELEYLEDHIVDIHDYLHLWNYDHDNADPTAFFTQIHNDIEKRYVDEPDHDHAHPESGKNITGIEKRYTDD